MRIYEVKKSLCLMFSGTPCIYEVKKSLCLMFSGTPCMQHLFGINLLTHHEEILKKIPLESSIYSLETNTPNWRLTYLIGDQHT